MLQDGKAIRFLDKETLLSFVNKYEERKIYPYYNQILYCKLSSNGSMKYKIFEINDDKVLVLYKDIKLITTKFIRLTGYPISLNGIQENEDEIYTLLCQEDNIKEIFINEYELHRIDKTRNDLEVCDYDFYSLIPLRMKEIDKSKWRSKYRINQFRKDIEFRLATKEDYHPIMQLHNDWKSNKKDVRSKKLFNGFFKQFNNLIEQEIVYVLTYKGAIIGFTVLDEINNHTRHMPIQQYYTVHFAPKELLDDKSESLFRHIGQIFYYFMVKELHELGCVYLSVAGSANLKDSLIEFKSRIHKSNITYYKYRIK